MSINKDVKGKEIIDCQTMIDLTSQQLFRLRLRDDEDSNELIRSDIRAQEVINSLHVAVVTLLKIHICATRLVIDRVSVPSPIVTDILMDTMARDRAHMY